MDRSQFQLLKLFYFLFEDSVFLKGIIGFVLHIIDFFKFIWALLIWIGRRSIKWSTYFVTLAIIILMAKIFMLSDIWIIITLYLTLFCIFFRAEIDIAAEGFHRFYMRYWCLILDLKCIWVIVLANLPSWGVSGKVNTWMMDEPKY